MTISEALGRLLGRKPSCQDVNRFLADFLDGELPLETRTRFEQHLDACPACKTYFDQYAETIRLVREDTVEIPADLAEHTLQFLRSKAVLG